MPFLETLGQEQLSGFDHDVACLFEPGSRAFGDISMGAHDGDDSSLES